MSHVPPPDVDPQIWALVQHLGQSTMGPPPPQDTPPPPIAQQPYVQAEQLTAQAAPPPDPTQGMSPMKAALYKGIQGFGQGLAYSHTPGGYAGHVQQQYENERQREQDLLNRAKELRGEGMQQSQLNQRSIDANLDREAETSYRNATLEETKRLRTTQEQAQERLANQPTIVPQGSAVLPHGATEPSYVNPRTTASGNIDPNSPEGIAARLEFDKKRFHQPPVPVVIQTGEGPQLLNRASNKASPVLDQTGKQVPPPPTSAQKDQRVAYKKIGPVLDSISELSEKINTGKGLEARVSGEVEKARARANYNDDVAEYQALISGFTPLVARAVGHTGVLTEQDVQSVKEMFPKPGDSKTLRDRKIKRLNTILAGVEDVMSQGLGGGTAPATQADPLGVR